MKPLLTIIILCVLSSTYAQKSQKQIDREKNKVDTLYTVEERANIGLWMHDQVKTMNLSEEKEDEYYRIMLSDVYDLQRLDDKDKDYTPEERQEKFEAIVDRMNSKIKAILTPEQYQKHIDAFNQILRSVYKKANWVWNKD
ncbi:MAG: hypothetical protein AAF901_05715 [Bacteroidota bacterium]